MENKPDDLEQKELTELYNSMKDERFYGFGNTIAMSRGNTFELWYQVTEPFRGVRTIMEIKNGNLIYEDKSIEVTKINWKKVLAYIHYYELDKAEKKFLLPSLITDGGPSYSLHLRMYDVEINSPHGFAQYDKKQEKGLKKLANYFIELFEP